MKRMLINATQQEELRMAMVDGQRLYDLNIELPANERKKANIYKGQITRIEPSLEAAFVNYGGDRHGFLPLKEISSEYFVADVEPGGKVNIRDVLREGQDIVVQIDKEERGNKGAALTTFVSLAGRFIVLKPNKPKSGGVSRRILGDDRDLARQAMRDVEIPDGMSVILRTAGIERSAEELNWDIQNLLSVWEAIKKVVVARPSPFLIYRESNAVVRALRDYMTTDIGEILIDDEATYTEAREFVEQVMPQNLRKLKFYDDSVPLFTRYQIETQIESAFAHSVILPSGGSLVIDHTEALVSVDINSARATKGGDIEATALNTNLEAADEVARQLRLRDLGGLVVIDFIDMGPQKNQREVENRLREAVRQDRARVQLGKISRFGLLEMSRQRLRPSLGESSYLVCPRCSGIGNIRSVESLALAILRIIGEEARKERTAKVIAQLPVEVATYLLNEKRDWVQGLESRHGTQVILVANSALETPHYLVRRVRDDQVELPENVGVSYTLAESDTEAEIAEAIKEKKAAEVAAITTVVATTPAPVRSEPKKEAKPGLLARFFSLFVSSDEEPGKTKKRPAKARESSASDSRRRSNQGGRKRGEGQRQPARKPQRSGKQARNKTTATGEQRGEAPQKESQADRDAAQQAGAAPEKRDESRPASGKRRSRGGRRRRRGQDAADNAEQPATAGREAQTARSTDTAGSPRRGQSRRPPSEASTTESDASAATEQPTEQRGAEAPAADTQVATPDNRQPVNGGADSAPVQQEVAKPEAADSVPPQREPQPADDDETQPALRKLAVVEERAPQEQVNGAPTATEAEHRAKSANGGSQPEEPEKQREESASAKVDKPSGRLLPWEPAPDTGAEPTDKD